MSDLTVENVQLVYTISFLLKYFLNHGHEHRFIQLRYHHHLPPEKSLICFK